jgi:hypothetical protein
MKRYIVAFIAAALTVHFIVWGITEWEYVILLCNKSPSHLFSIENFRFAASNV